LYEKYNDEMGENAVGERRLRNFVESIEEKKLVSSKEIDLGGRGRTREFNALVKVSP
jgi:Cdc6-like AAA superfamily ATPase